MILAIDTSTRWMGLSLFDGAEILYEKVWHTKRRHTVELMPAIQAALTETGLGTGDLKSVAVALGPGSFTSLRIGLATAKGLALAERIPVVGIPSLDVTASGQELTNKPMIAVLKAGRGRLAAQRYHPGEGRWEPEGEIFMATPMDLERMVTSPTILCGEIDSEARRILERRWRNAHVARPSKNTRRPAILAELAWELFENGRFDDTASLAPIYLRTASTPS